LGCLGGSLGSSDEEASGDVGGSGVVEEGKRGMLVGKGVSCGVADLEVGSVFGLTGVITSNSEEDEDMEGEGGRGIMVFDEEDSSVARKMGTSTYSTSVLHMCLRYEVYCIRIIKLIQKEHSCNIIEDERKKYQKNR